MFIGLISDLSDVWTSSFSCFLPGFGYKGSFFSLSFG